MAEGRDAESAGMRRYGQQQEEHAEEAELDERLDYNLPASTRVIIRSCALRNACIRARMQSLPELQPLVALSAAAHYHC